MSFNIPGMSASRRTYRNRALAFLAGLVVAAVAVTLIVRAVPSDDLAVTMRTEVVAGGIQSGSSVVLNGSEVGLVTGVEPTGPQTFDVHMAIDPELVGPVPGVLTDTVSVNYAPKNFFGIAAVIMNSGPGGSDLRDGAVFTPATPEDATLTTLLRNLSDLQNEAFDPYMSDPLAVANRATNGLMPLLGAVGQIAEDIAETQVVSPRETLPQFTELVAQVRGTVDDLLPGIKRIMDWQAPREPGYLEASEAGLSYTAGPFMDELTALLSNEEIGSLMPLMPVVEDLLVRIQDTFPDARRNGIQIATLIRRLDQALPIGPDGLPVLNVDAVLNATPAVSAALRLSDELVAGGER